MGFWFNINKFSHTLKNKKTNNKQVEVSRPAEEAVGGGTKECQVGFPWWYSE